MAKKKAVKKSAAPAKSEGEILACAAADYADNKKAGDILVMDLRGLSTVTDFMVLCSVDSLPQLRAVRDEIWDEIEKNHEAYAENRTIVTVNGIRKRARAARELAKV